MHCQASSSSGPRVSLPRWGYRLQSSALGTVEHPPHPPIATSCNPARPHADAQSRSKRSDDPLVGPLRWTQSGKSSRLANEPAGAPRDAATAAAPCAARAGCARPAAADCAASAPRAASASGDCAPSGATSAASLGELLANRLKVFSVENEERSEVDVGDFLITQIDLRTQHVIG
jgi:hypothetical protein